METGHGSVEVEQTLRLARDAIERDIARYRVGVFVTVAALTVALRLAGLSGVWTPTLSFAAESDFYRGVAFLREKHDAATAADYFRRSAAGDPSDPRPWFELGNALDASGRRDEAVDTWKRAAAADPWDVRPLRRASMVLSRSGDLAGAIAAIEANVGTKLREDAIYAPDWLNLAFLRARSGQLDRAIEELRKAARADPLYFRQHAPHLPRADIADPRFAQAIDDLLR